MKILLCFIDMLRPDLLNLYGNRFVSQVDLFFEKLGGTVYRNCYTPGPDTPRSTACILTGCYPKKNGCDARVKYPKYFLKKNISTFLDVLKDNGIALKFYLDRYNVDIGFLPQGFYTDENLCGSDLVIQDYLDKFTVKEDSFNFFYFPDFHNTVMDMDYSEKTPQIGLKKLYCILNILTEKLDFSNFDYCIFLSDHGYRLKRDMHKNLLDSYRSRIFLFVHKKGDEKIIYSDKLKSTLDIAPMIAQLYTGKEFKCDGMNLLSEYEHEYVLLEDHADFSVKLNQSIERYGVITPSGKYFTDCSGCWEYSGAVLSSDMQKYFTSLLENNMTQYKENEFLFERLQFYKKNIYLKYNSDGTLRRKSLKLRFKESVFFGWIKKVTYPIVKHLI
ncbi:hypothetical protein HMPREF0860_0469 [Treponema socranskii subsp. socranskii VPI DR56BR1116 = ATCC 35536]|uniref:Type I phosphodiesterase/nucleotide pyrophosphatase n=1 Tax=Treponema socranskii subsp. socranskii VPI DR56BR1116 = ATCC 35536 TaxID=1125725 RepID=A0ABN0P2F6_TRESO|nr:hypothetical protein [Treponema socranskii]ERJ97763.1 hypothetical protein HMPREF0860_0469 [Treponema socranskii subsp. socranskii VPI DR56BR1116 = ATCC 35536]